MYEIVDGNGRRFCGGFESEHDAEQTLVVAVTLLKLAAETVVESESTLKAAVELADRLVALAGGKVQEEKAEAQAEEGGE